MTRQRSLKDARLNIAIPSELKARLFTIADKNDVSVARIVRLGITAELGKLAPTKLRLGQNG